MAKRKKPALGKHPLESIVPKKEKPAFQKDATGEHVAEGVKNEPGETKAEAFGKQGEIATETPTDIPELGGLDLGKMGENVAKMAEEARAHSQEARGAAEGLKEGMAAEASPLTGEEAVIDDAPEWTTGQEATKTATETSPFAEETEAVLNEAPELGTGTSTATATETAGAAGEITGFAASVSKFGKIAQPIGWGIATAEAAEGASRLDIQDTAKPLLTMGGAVAGAKLGAIAGTAVAPGIGTAIGAVAGAIGGAVVGEKVGEQLPHSVAGIQSDPGGMQTITASSQDQNAFSPNDMMQQLRMMNRHMQSMVNDGVRVRETGARTGNKL